MRLGKTSWYCQGSNNSGTGDRRRGLDFSAVEGLEWTYQHSRPGLNEYNIRVVSNSWGTNGDYNPSMP